MLFVMIVFIFLLEYYVKKHMDKVRTLEEQRNIAGGKIVLKKYYNTGAAVNVLKHYPKLVKCLHAASLAGIFVIWLRVLPEKNGNVTKLGLSFLLGGGISNFYDRIVKGYVVDYVSFGFGPRRFRNLVFNMADFFIFAGIILCTAQVLWKEGTAWQYKR